MVKAVSVQQVQVKLPMSSSDKTITFDTFQLAVVRQALVILLKQSKGEMLAALKGDTKSSAAVASTTAGICSEVITIIDKT